MMDPLLLVLVVFYWFVSVVIAYEAGHLNGWIQGLSETGDDL